MLASNSVQWDEIPIPLLYVEICRKVFIQNVKKILQKEQMFDILFS